jgi:hypothetical protein
MSRLRLTQRCMDALAQLPATDAQALEEKFFALRGQVPEGGERVVGLHEHLCMSLHAGRYRGVTWRDADHDAVWLLIAGVHREDSREDLYDVAIGLEQAGQLYPSEADYRRLAEDAQIERIAQEAAQLAVLRDEALAAADGIVRRFTSADDLYADIWAEVVSGLDEGEVVLRLRVRRGGAVWLSEEEIGILLAIVFEDRAQREEVEDDYLFRRFAAYFQLPRASH